MATLQKIRTKAGLLVAIVIGISLAAFILGDMFQGGGSTLFQKDRLEVGEIDGESIQYPEYQRQVERLGEIYKMNTQQNQLDDNAWAEVREQTWQEIVREIVMDDVYDDLGLAVSSDELFDMLQGANLHPIVQQLFRDPNTGTVDRGAVVRFLKNLETGVAPEQRDYWYYLEDQIVEERIASKYNNLVSKGLYVTSEEAQSNLNKKSRQLNFDYIALNYNSVADTQVVVTENDLKEYYNKNKENYEQEKRRRIEYITFDVEPSNEDYQQAEEWINDIKPEFAQAEDNVQFVNSNSDVGFDNTWYKTEELPENIANWITEENAEVGDVFGPYFEDEAYKLAKFHASEMMPDSVEARHILLQVNTQEELPQVQNLADSLKTAIENGADFTELAREYSADQGSAAQGGSLGWFGRGQMVAPFEEAAFNNEIDEVSIVTSQFGIHITQTTGKGEETRQYQIAYLVRNVEPSTNTYQNTYAKASQFAGENTTVEQFNEAVEQQQFNKKTATVRENDRDIPGLENARPLIRAAYDSNEGKLIRDEQGSTIFDLDDSFVIAALTSVTEEGIADFEDVRPRIELAVIKEKKAELLKEEARNALEDNSDLEAVAGELGKTVQNVSGVNFSSVQIPGLGMEPAVTGAASALAVDQISKPVEGNNGVYILKVTSVNDTPAGDVAAEKNSMAQNLNMRVSSQAYEVHREHTEIEDRRSKFY